MAIRNVDRCEGTDQQGGRSGCSARALRGGLGDAHSLQGRDTIKTWGLKLAKSKCHAKARVAVARKLAVVMHAMWRDGTFYVGDPHATEEETAIWIPAKAKRLSYGRT